MKILFVVNNAAFFASHRLPIALAALNKGDDVALITGRAGSATLEAGAIDELAKCGMPHTICSFGSSTMNPFREAHGFWRLWRTLKRFSPDVVHCVSPKGVLYGGIAARLAGVHGVVLAVSGMGYLFTSSASGNARKLLRAFYDRVVRYAYGHSNKRVIVQNRDDYASLLSAGLADASEFVLIPGSGVPLDVYASVDESRRENLVVLPARLLRDKGVVEFAAAAAKLRAAGCKWRFVLAGPGDYINPSAVPESEVRAWEAAGTLEWWGHCADMPALFARARIVCLPSYREGMPKALLEAAAAGCAIVTTDVTGCREAIQPGISGDLVPAADTDALAGALGALIRDPARVESYGRAGRQLAQSRFGLDAVIARTLAIYEDLDASRRGAKP